MSADYPRDLIGYGSNPPHPHWPGNARIALSFVLNYEEGGERNILHGDKESEAFLSEMVAAQPLQGADGGVEPFCELVFDNHMQGGVGLQVAARLVA